ncbi:hypothetical protein [Micromonospora sp. CPCC 205714]|uniref:hypothetical protein n=1 Tax=Micromonospora sp. CPCC 205714 TaxID=3122402 RepID=UPI003FA58704
MGPPAAEQPYDGPGRRSAEEPDWSGPSWNRPSWGGGWAPRWAREDEPPTSRRARSDRAPEWSAEPARPYEPVRAEPARPYEPVRAEPARPYEPVRSEEPRPYELTRAEREARAEPSTDRPAAPERFAEDGPTGWAGGRSATAPPSVTPRSAPPASAPPAGASAGAPPATAPSSAPPAAPASAPPADPPYGTSSAGTAHGTSSSSGSYGPPPSAGSYGSPPSSGSYGSSPSAGSYGSSPSAGSYGSSPSTEPYGASPSTGAYRPSEVDASYRTSPTTGSYGGPPVTAPRSAPPAEAPAAAPRSAPPAADRGAGAAYGAPPVRTAEPAADGTATADRADRPFRLRSVPAESAAAPAERPGHEPTTTGPGAASDPATSGPRRLDRPPPAPAPTSAPPYAARRSAPDPAPPAEPAVEDGTPGPGAAVLPQRVPAEPDVPVVPEPPAVEPPAETPELARIATHLRRDDEPAPLRERPEGFDVNAILDAVREVPGVRDAALRRTPAGAHSLRLDLADGADPAEVSRVVARLLQERMGLAAAPQNLPGTAPAPAPLRRRSAETRAPESRGADPRPGETGAGPRDAESGPTELRRQDPGAGPARRSRAADPSSGPADPSGREGRAPAAAGRLVSDPAPGARPAAAASTPAPGRVEDTPSTVAGVPRRRRQVSAHRGRASVDEASLTSAPPATGSPATLGTSYSGGQMTTTETAPSRPLDTGGAPGPRVVIDHVQVSTFGLDATVEVRLLAGGETAAGHSTGPAVDGYVLRLCAVAAAAAVDQLLRGGEGTAERGRCFVEHAAVVPFGNCEVATVVVLLVCDGWVEQLAGSALVAGDPRQAVVRATLAAVNRRLEALLA